MWKALWEIHLASGTWIRSVVQISILKEKADRETHLEENAFVGTSYPKGSMYLIQGNKTIVLYMCQIEAGIGPESRKSSLWHPPGHATFWTMTSLKLHELWSLVYKTAVVISIYPVLFVISVKHLVFFSS